MKGDEEGAHQLQGASAHELIGAPWLLPPVEQVAPRGGLAAGHGGIPDLFRKINRSSSSFGLWAASDETKWDWYIIIYWIRFFKTKKTSKPLLLSNRRDHVPMEQQQKNWEGAEEADGEKRASAEEAKRTSFLGEACRRLPERAKRPQSDRDGIPIA